MGGVLFSTDQAYVWTLPFSKSLQEHLVLPDNPSSNITMIDLELAAHVMQLALWAPMTMPLEHMFNATDSMVTDIYARKGAVSKLGMAALLLLWRAHILCTHQLASTFFYLPDNQNILANLASCNAHLPPAALLHLMKRSFHIATHNKRLDLEWSRPERAPTALTGNSGAYSATGSKYQPTCPHSLTQPQCSKSLLTMYDMEHLLGTNNPS
eukprot:8792808-Ditylum_brightwellii.AAC.1